MRWSNGDKILSEMTKSFCMPCYLKKQKIWYVRLYIYIHTHKYMYIYIYIYLFFWIFRAAPVAYGNSQARGRIGAASSGLCHSHSNAGFEPHLQPVYMHVYF